MGHPHQRIGIDDGEADELARVRGEAIQQRLADVGNAGRRVELLPKNREPHGEAVETRLRVLLGPSVFDQCRKQPVGPALRQLQAIGYLAKRHFACFVGEQLDD